MDRYSEFKNAISHKVHELKISAANDINITSIPIKNLPGKCCGQRKKKYSLTHQASSLLNFTFAECQKLGDHASFSGTLMHSNLMYKTTKTLWIQHATVNRPIRSNYRYSRPGKLEYRYHCICHVL